MNYIRFFISSTFSDMTRERDILNRVLTDLRLEFLSKDWMIEWVDLRWGISHEASLDNRTMRICIEELNRCRKLSPRPNFIILAGERYGWIPLPEIIPFSDVDLDVLNFLDKKDLLLFKEWYLLDSNALPDGEYLLKPRRNEYVDNEIYESYVVTNLRRILPIICRGMTAEKLGLSATAYEIYAGLDSLTASDTFVYRRHLANIPQMAHGFFKDDNKEEIVKIQELYSYIDRLVEKDNSLYFYGEYNDYISGKYDEEIYTSMRSKLSRIVSKVISERHDSMPKTENDFHLALASEMKKDLVGRAETLDILMEYINSDKSYPLLISAPSGIGKSSLMAMLINNITMHTDNVVVARFCGKTFESTDGDKLLNSIFNDIFVHTENYKRHPRRVVIRNRGWRIKDIFRLRCDRRVVVIIDSINSVDDTNAKYFFSLNWLDVELSKNIKVIVTCTPEKISEFSYNIIRCIQLPGFGTESIKVVETILSNNNRTITEHQYDNVYKAISLSDKSGLYLSVLANYLIDIPSWVMLTKIPHTLESLIDLILNNLRSPENHGQRIVDLSLQILASTTLGLSDEEIYGILSEDKVLAHEVKLNGMHSISSGAAAVPQIFWIRLQADLHGIIKKRQTPVGFHTVIAHGIIRDYIFRKLMAEKRTLFHIYEAVYNYFYPLVSKDSPHAIYESAQLAYQMVVCADSKNEESNNVYKSYLDIAIDNLWNLLINPEYIINKAIRFREHLLREYSEYGVIFRGKGYSLDKLTRLSNEIVLLPRSGNNEDIKSFIFNMPDESEIRKCLLSNPEKNLIDIWKNHRINTSIVHAVYDVNAFPNISIDGNRIASLSDNGSILNVTNIAVSDCENIIIPLGIKGNKLVSDNILNVHVVSATDCILLIESDTRKILRWDVRNAIGFLSSDGRFVTIIYANICLQYDRKTDYQNSFEYNIKSSFPVSSGRYIWIIDEENKLIRTDFQTQDTIRFHLANEILFATDNICITKNLSDIEIFSLYFIEGHYKYQKQSLPYPYIDKDQIWFDKLNDTLYINNGIALQEVKIINNQISVKSLGMQPYILTTKGNYALRMDPLSIVRWRDMLKEINILTSFNSGIGSFSVSLDGSVAVMSIGINRRQEAYRYILMLTTTGIEKICLPFENNCYDIITSVAVSPDGNYIGACSNVGELILVRRSDMSIMGRFFSESEGCLSISFSSDNRKMLAVCDHFIHNLHPIIHIGDTSTGQIKPAQGQPNWNDPANFNSMPWPQGESKFIQGSRFVRLGDFNIWDVKKMRMLLPTHVDILFHYTRLPKNEYHSIGHGPRECIFEHPQTGLLICSSRGTQTEIDLSNGTMHQFDNDKDLIGISEDGKFLYYIDIHNKLWVYFENLYQMIADDVVAVYPSVSDSFELYAYTGSSYILLINIFGEELGKAYVPDLWHAIPTTRGLAVATPRGPLMLVCSNPT